MHGVFEILIIKMKTFFFFGIVTIEILLVHEIISRVHEIINEWAILILVLYQMTTKAIRVTYSLEVTMYRI